MFEGEVTIVFKEILSNKTELALQLSFFPRAHYSAQVYRLSLLLSSLFHNTPLLCHNTILPLSESLGLCPYSCMQSLSSILQANNHLLPPKYKDKGFQYSLWKNCNSSEDWSRQMTSFSYSLHQRAFETTFLSMGILNSSHLLIDNSSCILYVLLSSVDGVLFFDYQRTFSSLNELCQIQLEKGSDPHFYRVHKHVYLDVLNSNLSTIKNMVLCEIVDIGIDSISSIVLDSLDHRAEEIQRDDWKGIVYL